MSLTEFCVALTLTEITLVTIVSVANLLFISRLKKRKNIFASVECTEKKHKTYYPMISILCPMRNEESNAQTFVDLAVKQNYPNFEVIVVNDHSTDDTYKILEDLQEKYKGKFFVHNSTELPEGWRGKNWALHQLSQHAKGDILMFFDADVKITKGAISDLADFLITDKVDMFSGFSNFVFNSLFSDLILSNLIWSLLSFLPAPLIKRIKYYLITAASGQCIVMWKKVYEGSGGYSQLKNKLIDDIGISRMLKKNGYKVDIVLLYDLLRCDTYEDAGKSFKGLSRSLYSTFPMLLFWFLAIPLYFIGFVLPFIFFPFSPVFLVPVILLYFQNWVVKYIQLKSVREFDKSLVTHFTLVWLLTPVERISFLVAMIHSLIISQFFTVEWRGRKVDLKTK